MLRSWRPCTAWRPGACLWIPNRCVVPPHLLRCLFCVGMHVWHRINCRCATLQRRPCLQQIVLTARFVTVIDS